MSAVLDEQAVALALLRYCRENNWAGYDPYDALNSRLYLALPFLHSRWPRIVLTQALKRSPINIRPFVAIPRKQNSKAMGLFAEAVLKLSGLGLIQDDRLVHEIARTILKLRAPGSRYSCWGYSFPWQTRTVVVPEASPNLVCTTFVANSLVTVFEATGNAEYLDVALSAGQYISNELFWTEGNVASFSYPLQGEKSRIHNANLLAAALLCRLHRHAGNDRFVDVAFKAARYSVSRQRDDGSWMYGELPTQQWIDNFHTGYNLAGLQAMSEYTRTAEFEGSIQRGYEFYVDHFFRDDGAARYFHDRTYPIDVHCVAQSLITLTEFKDRHASSLDLANKVYGWAMKNLWNQGGYFYYRVLPYCKIRTSYMRWGQAWMLLALSTFLERNTVQTAPALN